MKAMQKLGGGGWNVPVYLIILHYASLQAPSHTDHIWPIIRAEYNGKIHTLSCIIHTIRVSCFRFLPVHSYPRLRGRNGSVESLEIKDQNFLVAYIYHHFLVWLPKQTVSCHQGLGWLIYEEMRRKFGNTGKGPHWLSHCRKKYSSLLVVRINLDLRTLA